MSEHDVLVKWKTPRSVCATVRDGQGVHDVHHHGRWRCSCGDVTATCDHVTAVQRVTTEPETPPNKRR